jgi:hypothetical protein
MNRDGMHSVLRTDGYPGLTAVRLDQVGRDRGLDLDIPNILFPNPVFGNSSRAFTHPTYWRSIPRMLMTGEVGQLDKMVRFQDQTGIPNERIEALAQLLQRRILRIQRRQMGRNSENL